MHGSNFAQNGGSYSCSPGSQSDGFNVNGWTPYLETQEGPPVGFTLAPHAASGAFVRQAKAQTPKLTRKQRRAKAAAKAKAMLNEEDMFESTRPPATTTSD